MKVNLILKLLPALFLFVLPLTVGCSSGDDPSTPPQTEEEAQDEPQDEPQNEEEEEPLNIIYDPPFNITPAKDTVFYSYERFTISWELPDGLKYSEYQILESNTPIDTTDVAAFEYSIMGGTGGGDPPYSYNFAYLEDPSNPITEPIYIGYRIRGRDLELEPGYSEWTPIRTFTILPLTDFEKHTVNVTYDFMFITEEINHEYYSGVLEKEGYLLEDIAAGNNLVLEDIRVVRHISAEGNFLTLTAEGQNPFNPLTFGYNDSPEAITSVYPFDPIGQVFVGSYQESPAPAQLYNLRANLINDVKEYPFKMTYKLVDEPNTEHHVELTITFDIYVNL